MSYPRLVLELPAWVEEVVQAAGDLVDSSTEKRMRLALELSRRSVEEGGGPFGAVVFDARGRVVAPGVNLVVPAGTSIAHAEIVALSVAQQVRGHYDLGDGGEELHLFTSTEPCAQCFGAVPWSGVKRVVCGAATEDAEEIGFDEGPKPERWVAALEQRGISVECGVLREEARAILRHYANSGGLIYNADGA